MLCVCFICCNCTFRTFHINISTICIIPVCWNLTINSIYFKFMSTRCCGWGLVRCRRKQLLLKKYYVLVYKKEKNRFLWLTWKMSFKKSSYPHQLNRLFFCSPYTVYKWSKKPQGFGEPRLHQGIWIHNFVWGGSAMSDSENNCAWLMNHLLLKFQDIPLHS